MVESTTANPEVSSLNLGVDLQDVAESTQLYWVPIWSSCVFPNKLNPKSCSVVQAVNSFKPISVFYILLVLHFYTLLDWPLKILNVKIVLFNVYSLYTFLGSIIVRLIEVNSL